MYKLKEEELHFIDADKTVFKRCKSSFYLVGIYEIAFFRNSHFGLDCGVASFRLNRIKKARRLYANTPNRIPF